MINRNTITIIGGDLRSAHLANLIASKNSNDIVYGLFLDSDINMSNKIMFRNNTKLVLPQSNVIIFPLPILDKSGNINTPLSKLKISPKECFDYIPRDALVLGGKIPEEITKVAHEKRIKIVDYLEREEFAVLNAIPTAEGAVEIALAKLPITLYNSTCMLMGYGRISKVLLRLLCGFGAKVYVAARKHSDLAWISASGGIAVHMSEIDEYLKNVDVLFNTVPVHILCKNQLKKLKRSCLIIDLASKPGGVDFEIAQKLELQTIWALSLPGKVAPLSAGEIIYKTVCNILAEEGIL